jgi:hypothetical protein
MKNMKTIKNINLTREVLSPDQQKVIKKKTLWLRLLGIIMPSIYLFWARSYRTAVLSWLFFICYMAINGSGYDTLERVLEVGMVWMRILVLIQWAKRAFNNSKWNLKKLV